MSDQGRNAFKDDMTGRLLLGRYRIVRRLASGGMGVVHLARSEGADGFVKPVVVKLVHPHFAVSAEFSNMFIREARILSHLHHAGIVDVLDFAKEGDLSALVLEYVSGFQLREWVKFRNHVGTPLPTEVILRVAVDVLDALHYAHTLKRPDGEPMRIVHRDISPSNILIDTEGHSHLLDFGIAFVAEGPSAFATSAKRFKGKFPYAAPVLFSGLGASVASDVYAFGVMLHELLTGSNEFSTRDERSTINLILNHTLSSVLAARPEAPARLDAVIQRATAKKPEERYASADELRRDLLELLTVDRIDSPAHVAELASRDFGEEMAAFLGVESLASRDRAWRNPSLLPQEVTDPGVEAREPTKRQSVGPTVRGRAAGRFTPMSEPGPEAPPPKSGRRVPLAVGITGAVAIAAAVFAAVFLQREEKPAPNIVVVKSDVAPPVESPAAAVTEAAPAGEKGPAADAGQPTSPRAERASARKGGTSAELGAAFRKRKRDVSRCFETNAIELTGNPQIAVEFSIDASGKVLGASIQPQSLAGTTLEKCLLAVAKSTRFPAQGADVSFRIPVTASVRAPGP